MENAPTPEPSNLQPYHEHTAVEASLTPQQLRFVQEYLVDLNATAAYLRAGYQPGSLAVANTLASRLLSNVQVEMAIAARQAQIDRNLGVSAERIERQSARIAFSDIRDIVEIDADGQARVKPTSEWSDAAAAAVASVTITEHRGQTKITVKMKDSVAALEQLYKRQNLYREHQAAGGEALADAMAAALRDANRQIRVTDVPETPELPPPATVDGEYREADAAE